MPTVSTNSSAPPVVDLATAPDRSDLGVPTWVSDLLGRSGARHAHAESPDMSVVESPAFALVTVRKPGAATFDPQAFEAATRDAYNAIAGRLRNCAARHPVRFWNYIPDIHRPCGEGLDRYMCFNAGRFAACSDWLGGPDTFDRLLATGSGVGHRGQDLVIHALAAAVPGTAVENPRQIPAYRYSRRFGPKPPCFARATVLPGAAGRGTMLLVGGTASIRGEQSTHTNSLAGQIGETFDNLSSLFSSAFGDGAGSGLEAFTELRVYHVDAADRDVIATRVVAEFPHLRRAEYLRADLCRQELAVEIEGVAESKSEISTLKSQI